LKADSCLQENLRARGDAIQQKETGWLEMAVTLNCSFVTTHEAPAMPNRAPATVKFPCKIFGPCNNLPLPVQLNFTGNGLLEVFFHVTKKFHVSFPALG
jgi:hypothetical protein